MMEPFVGEGIIVRRVSVRMMQACFVVRRYVCSLLNLLDRWSNIEIR